MKDPIKILLYLIAGVILFIIVSIITALISAKTIEIKSTVDPPGIEIKQESIFGEASYYDYDLRREDQRCLENDCWSISHRTAASRDYLKGTVLIVIAGDRFTTVLVNDYGPAESTGRVIDLSSRAFRDLAPLSQGIIKEVEIRKR